MNWLRKLYTKHPQKLFWALFAMTCLGMSLWSYLPVWHKLTLPVHNWAQSDRLALAFKFYENGFQFFRPQTYSQLAIDGVAGVEFPIQSYLAALLGLIFGKSAIPLIFKLITLSCLIGAMASISQLCWKRTKHIVLSLMPIAFLWGSSLVVYYGFSYLPDVAAFSILIIAICQLVEAVTERNFRRGNLAFWLAVLAAMIKLSLAFYLPFVVFILWREAFWAKRTNWDGELISISIQSVVAFLLILANYLYIQYLHEHYDSNTFLSKPRPLAGTWGEMVNYVYHKVWGMHKSYILPRPGVHLLSMMLVLTGIQLFKVNKLSFGLIGIAAFMIGILNLYLMGQQLAIHDYYLINIVFPLCLFIFITGILFLGKRWKSIPFRLRFVLIGLGLFVLGKQIDQANHAYMRYVSFDEGYFGENDRWLFHAEIQPDELPIPQEAQILLNTGHAPNVGLVYFQRDGLISKENLKTDSADNLIEIMLDKQIDYLILGNNQIQDIENQQINFFDHFENVHQGNNYSCFHLHR